MSDLGGLEGERSTGGGVATLYAIFRCLGGQADRSMRAAESFGVVRQLFLHDDDERAPIFPVSGLTRARGPFAMAFVGRLFMFAGLSRRCGFESITRALL